MGRPTEAQKAAKAKDNGQAPELPTVPPFTLEEINLFHQMLTQVSFPEAASKQIAAGAQMKIEAWAGTRPE